MKRIIILVAIALIGCGLFFSRTRYFNRPENSALNLKSPAETIIPANDIFFEQKYFYPAVAKAKNYGSQENIKAVIMPHHLLASEIMAGILARAKNDKVKNLIIIGPDHENKSAAAVGSAYLRWQTPFGQAATDSRLVSAFLSDLKLYNRPESFLNEHSIGAIIPFVKYYYPDAKILPILFNSSAGLSEAQSVADWLNHNLDGDSLVIFSLDFSHYLTEHQAADKDKITKELILSRDFSKIIKLDSAYVDSPAGLAAALIYADDKKLRTKIIYEKNSNDFLEQPAAETTSYFGVLFEDF